MSVNKTLVEFFGAGAEQTETSLTLIKGALASTRTPPAYSPLVGSLTNTAEALFLAILLKVYETQDTSQDAEVAIYGPETALVEIVSDGVATPYQQSLFTVRVLNKMTGLMPNPNLI